MQFDGYSKKQNKYKGKNLQFYKNITLRANLEGDG